MLFEAAMVCLIGLSVSVLIAHAIDAFRLARQFWQPPRSRSVRSGSCRVAGGCGQVGRSGARFARAEMD